MKEVYVRGYRQYYASFIVPQRKIPVFPFGGSKDDPMEAIDEIIHSFPWPQATKLSPPSKRISTARLHFSLGLLQL